MHLSAELFAHALRHALSVLVRLRHAASILCGALAARTVDAFAGRTRSVPDTLAPAALALEAVATFLTASAEHVLAEWRALKRSAVIAARVVLKVVSIVAELSVIDDAISAVGAVCSADCSVRQNGTRRITGLAMGRIDDIVAAAGLTTASAITSRRTFSRRVSRIAKNAFEGIFSTDFFSPKSSAASTSYILASGRAAVIDAIVTSPVCGTIDGMSDSARCRKASIRASWGRRRCRRWCRCWCWRRRGSRCWCRRRHGCWRRARSRALLEVAPGAIAKACNIDFRSIGATVTTAKYFLSGRS